MEIINEIVKFTEILLFKFLTNEISLKFYGSVTYIIKKKNMNRAINGNVNEKVL